jgi:DNA repair exonuclease SbcCD nuclease subunit
MAEFKFITRADVHLSDYPPASRIDDYRASIFKKLEQIYALAESNGCNAIIDSGDFFHIKSPVRNSHDLVGLVAKQHYSHKMPVLSIAGNHDIKHGNLGLLKSQPLGVLYETNTFTHIDDMTFTIEDMTVRVVGIDYQVDPTEALKSKTVKGNEDFLICVFHSDVCEVPIFPSDKFFSFQTLSKLDPDLWVLGHIHKDFGVVNCEGKYFISLGAVSRGALTYDEITRTPRVGLCTITKKSSVCSVEIKTIDLQVEEARAVFSFDRRDRLVKESRKIEDFIQTLLSSVNTTSEDRVGTSLDSLSLSKEVRDIINHYIEEASHEVT